MRRSSRRFRRARRLFTWLGHRTPIRPKRQNSDVWTSHRPRLTWRPRAGAERLGLITRRAMIAALVRAIETPPTEFVKTMEVPQIRQAAAYTCLEPPAGNAIMSRRG